MRRLLPAIQQGVVGIEMHPATSVEHLEPLVHRVLPDILHIVCHGTNEGEVRALSFEDRQGRRSPVSAARLRDLLDRLRVRRPGLLVLEACGSRPIGEALVAAGFGCVIAMEGDADPEAGARFFDAFYPALPAGRTICEAFAVARRDLELLCPLAVDTPVLLGDTAAIDGRIAGLPRAVPRGLARDSIDEHVSRSAAHAPAESELRGRDRDLARLIEAAVPERRRGLVLLRGPAGVGKTSLLRLWLDAQHELGWYGYSRVFTWMFDLTHRGRGVGDIHAFLVEALLFFGDSDRRFDGKDPTPEAYLHGLRLGRLIRDEPVLLVLDSVPMLPRGARAAKPATLESLLHPALAALLREVAGGAARCVLAARDGGGLSEVEGEVLDLAGLDDAAGADLLWEGGLIEDDTALKGLSASLGGEPLALRLCARSFTTVDEVRSALTRDGGARESRPLSRILGAITARMNAASRELLATLALREGTLSIEELPESHATPDGSARDIPSDDASRNRAASSFASLRPLVRAGIARVQRGSTTIELVHPALGDAALDLLGGDSARFASLLVCALAGLGPASTLAEIHRLAAIAVLAGRVGEHATARMIYKERICRAEAAGREQSLVARTLGAIAEDLTILGNFFLVEGGSRHWETLAGAGDDEVAAFIFHRVALALRHLGRVDEAVAPMACACAHYQRLELWERAATCANDLAELQAFRGDLDAALHAAERAVAWSHTSGDPITRFLTLATRGHVLHLRGHRDDARRDFENAESTLHETKAPFLFSRPGHQYLMLLLDDIEDSWRAGQVPGPAALEPVKERLAAARKRHRDPTIAPVSRALDAFAEGRLANLELEIELARGGDTSTSRRAAMSGLALAVSTFRSRHHLWMLPQALCERARMRRLLQDPVNASLDLDEAQALAEEFHLPFDLGACLLERIALCMASGRAQEGVRFLLQTWAILEDYPCARLAERVGLLERELADSGADLERKVREQ